uniref:Essential for reactive oxygen species protein n=1 Tax=Suricata suricatta TaxID=37032 RepID=A0A673VRJ8_SURSU
MYMQVESRTSSCLHLKRAPGIRSWSLLVGILSIGLAAAYYSGDALGWKLFYVMGCLFVAVQNLEDWEEAIFNKSTGKVVLKTFSLYKKLLTLFRAGHDQVTWKPSPSLLQPSWSCTALRAPWSCLRAATVRLMAQGARADDHRALALVLVAASGTSSKSSSSSWLCPWQPQVGPSTVPAACFHPLNKP